MRVALPVNGERLSPALDFASRLLVVDLEDNRVTRRQEVDFRETFTPAQAGRLRELSVDTVICGAVSTTLAAMTAHCGIRIIQGVAGTAAQVLAAFISGEIMNPQFALPGFCTRNRSRCRHNRGRGFRGGRRRGGPIQTM